MRVGVIGIGRMGSAHARILAEHDAVDKLLVHDADNHRARALAETLGALDVPDVDAVLAGVDAVVIASGTPSHPGLVERAMQAGVPALCEKPLAPDLAATHQLTRSIDESGGKVQVGFMRRFDPGYAAARELVVSGGIGRLYMLRATSNDGVTPPEAFVSTSGGMHADVQIHDFDLVRFITGDEVVEVYAGGTVVVEDYFARYGDIDAGTVLLYLASGAIGVASAIRHGPYGYDVRMELFGSADTVAVGWDDRTPLRRIDGTVAADPYHDFVDRFGEAYRRELDAFLDFARGRIDNPCPAADAREAMRIAVACDRSRAERRPVALEEIT